MSDHAALLAGYIASGRALSDAAASLSEDAVDARETNSDWSIRQVLHHVADVEIGDAMRLRLMLAHDGPLITAYDEQLFASRLHYDRPLAASLATFAALRESSISLLERMSIDDWSRRGHHEERPRYSVEILVEHGITHDRDHFQQIHRALAMIGAT